LCFYDFSKSTIVKTFYSILITLFIITLFSCNKASTTSSDIEGSWKMNKINYPNSYSSQKVTDEIIYTFKNGTATSGDLEVTTKSSQTTDAGEYELTDSGNTLEILFLGSSVITQYYIEAGVGVMKLSENSYSVEFIFTKE
jgi:hypothetical protein